MTKEFKDKINDLRRLNAGNVSNSGTIQATPVKRGRGRPKKVINQTQEPARAQTTEQVTSNMTDQTIQDPMIKEKTIKAISGVVKGVFDFWAGLDGIEEIKLHDIQAESLAEKIFDVLALEKPDFKLNPRLMAWGSLALIAFSVVKPRYEAIKKERERRKRVKKSETQETQQIPKINLAGDTKDNFQTERKMTIDEERNLVA